MKDTMKAIVVTGPDVVEIAQDIPVPEVGDYEALVRIRACGYCNGTDSHIISATLTKEGGMGELPTILGHEGAGEVVKLGSKVRYISIGDRFIRPNLPKEPAPGYSRTYGNMAEYGLVADIKAMIEDGFKEEDLPYKDSQGQFPRDMDFTDGGVLLSLLECHSSIEHFGIKKGSKVLIYGCGPMGLGMLRLIKLKEPSLVISVDGLESRLELAKKAGADRVIDFTKKDVNLSLNGEKFDFVVDCVGSSKIVIEGSHHLKEGGKLCGMGVLKSTDCMIDASKLKNNTSLHMHNFTYRRFDSLEPVLELIKEKKIDPKDFYSHVLPFRKIEEAIKLVKNKEALKVILTFDEEKTDIDVPKLKKAFKAASEKLIEKENELSELDSRTGDGDHGITMAKVAKAIIKVCLNTDKIDAAEFFYRLFDEIVAVNGGSIAPLWALMADGIAENLKNIEKEAQTLTKIMLEGALNGIKTVSKAKKGDKTLADPLIAALEAVKNGDRNNSAVLAAKAALYAAQDTKNMEAKFGRAKNLPDKGLGHPDPGAVSMAYFIDELKNAYFSEN